MNILFRAYGSHLMGMGHLYRVKKIINKLRQDLAIRVTLLTRIYDEALPIYNGLVVDKIIELDKNVSEQEEVAILESAAYDVVVNDQLNSSTAIANSIAKICKNSISFDDTGDGAHIFDHTINILYPSEKTLTNEINDYSYMILEDMSIFKRKATFSEKVKTIFINQGAADTWGAIPDIITDLNKLEQSVKIKVLLGPAFQHFDALEYALNLSPHKLEIEKKVDNVAAFAMDSDLAILGAGNTLFEIASLGIPIVASTREEKELITIRRLLGDNIVYAENKIYTSDLCELVNEVMANTDSRKEKFLQNRRIFGYSGLNQVTTLIKEA